jgi:hypothetical protein
MQSFYQSNEPGMRTLGLGGNGVVISNGTFGISENPSLLSFTSPVSVDHSFYVIPDMQMKQFIGGSVRLNDRWTIGMAGNRSYTSDQYLTLSPDAEETNGLRTLAAAWRVNRKLSLGINLEHATKHFNTGAIAPPNRPATNIESGSKVGMGLSASYKTSQQLNPELRYHLTAGTGIQNIVSGSFNTHNHELQLPGIFRFGLKHSLAFQQGPIKEGYNNFKITLHTSYLNFTTTNRNTQITGGIEFVFLDMLYYRTGINLDKRIRVDYENNRDVWYSSGWAHGAGVQLPMQRIADWNRQVVFSVDFYRMTSSNLMNYVSHAPFGLSFSMRYNP